MAPTSNLESRFCPNINIFQLSEPGGGDDASARDWAGHLGRGHGKDMTKTWQRYNGKNLLKGILFKISILGNDSETPVIFWTF